APTNGHDIVMNGHDIVIMLEASSRGCAPGKSLLAVTLASRLCASYISPERAFGNLKRPVCRSKTSMLRGNGAPQTSGARLSVMRNARHAVACAVLWHRHRAAILR